MSRVRQEGRWWWLQARHTRRIWRWGLLAALVVFAVLVLLRQPLADWFWKEPRIEQILQHGEQALAAGRLTAADGTGAKEYFQAALALDSDRTQARDGLARTGQAALRQADAAVVADEVATAEAALALARELQVPRAAADATATRIRAQRSQGVGLEQALQDGLQALAQGHLDDGPRSALPLFQQVLAVRGTDVRALEGREDALTDLLQQARVASGRGRLIEAEALLHGARSYDPGHADLPASEEAQAQAIDQQLRRSATALRRGRLDAAFNALQEPWQVAAEQPQVARAGERLLQEVLDDARRLGDDFQFTAAKRRIEQATALQATSAQLQVAMQALERAQQAQVASRGPSPPRREREQQLRAALAKVTAAEEAGRFLSPPGASAFDALRTAQALAPRDKRVLAAAQRLLPASRECFEDALRQNRVQGAGACLQAWQALAPADSAQADARRRLAQRWLAVGSERLGSGDLAFAARAADQARQWQPDLGDLDAFDNRLRQARGH